jgi:hypothetical protein
MNTSFHTPAYFKGLHFSSATLVFSLMRVARLDMVYLYTRCKVERGYLLLIIQLGKTIDTPLPTFLQKELA